jgi:hypothetical protein
LPSRHPAGGDDDPDADPDQAVRAEDPDAAPVGDLLPPAVGASVAANQDNDSLSHQDDEDYYSAQQVDAEVSEESNDEFTGDDDYEGGERPAIRRRLSTSVITVPLRWTRQSR